MKSKTTRNAIIVIAMVCGTAFAQELPAQMQAKMKQLQEGMERRGHEGRPPIQAALIMHRFPPLIAQGNTAEAERTVDRALSALNNPNDPLDKKIVKVQQG